MIAEPVLTPARRETLRAMLVRAAREGRVNLGDWASIDGFLLNAAVSIDDLSALSRTDLTIIRERAQAPSSLKESCEALIEWMDESGLASALLIVAILIGFVLLWRSMLTPVRAAEAMSGPDPSVAGGMLVGGVALAFIAIVVAATVSAARHRRRPKDDEAFGDTTGFGERER